MAGTWTFEDDALEKKNACSPGFDMLPKGVLADQECTQKDAQVKDEHDTKIQVDWTFSTGFEAGKTQRRWLYFQDGATIKFSGDSSDLKDGKILGTYSSNGDVAASLTPFGKGWVGIVGPHPEATKDWCECEIPYSAAPMDFATHRL